MAEEINDHRKCNVCGKTAELRFGTCWDCAEAESIIFEGTDMYEKGLNKSDEPAKKPMDKLRLLIQKGWRKQ